MAFVPNYRLAPPGGTFHALDPVRDLHAAVRWIREHAADYDVDPSRVGALGSSAGGNLAQMIGVTGRVGLGKVDVVVSWSGATRLQLCSQGSDPARTCATRTNYVGATWAVDPSDWNRASPYSYVTSDDAPMYLANSTDEIVAEEEATDMGDALAAAGVPYHVRLIPGSGHARAYESLVWDDSVAFLQSYLRPSVAARR